jgi:hypothetical protein
MPLRHTNLILGSKSNLYRLVQDEGYYLLSEESRCVTTQYLFSVLSGSVFRILRKDVNFYSHIKLKWSKIDILSWLEDSAVFQVPLGFTADKLPNYDFLVNLLYTVNREHEMFTGTREVEKLVEIPLK